MTQQTGANEQLLQGFFVHSMKDDLQTDSSSESSSVSTGNNPILLDLSTVGGSSDYNHRHVLEMKIFMEEIEERVNFLRLQMGKIQKTTSMHKEQMYNLIAEVSNLDESVSIITRVSEESLVQSRDSATFKFSVLAEIKRRQVSLHRQILECLLRSQSVGDSIDELTKQIALKQKETAAKLAEGESVSFIEMEEESRWEEILRHVKDHGDEVKSEVEILKQKDKELEQIIAKKVQKLKQKEEKSRRRSNEHSTKELQQYMTKNMQPLRQQEEQSRQRNHEPTTHLNVDALDIKRRIEQLKKETNKGDEHVKEAQNDGLRNEQQEAGRTFREKVDVGNVFVERHQSRAIGIRNDEQQTEATFQGKIDLGDVFVERHQTRAIAKVENKHMEQNSFVPNSSRLAALRNKRENLRKQFESKQSRLRTMQPISDVGGEESNNMHIGSLRTITNKISELMEDQRSRILNLKARRSNRDQQEFASPKGY